MKWSTHKCFSSSEDIAGRPQFPVSQRASFCASDGWSCCDSDVCFSSGNCCMSSFIKFMGPKASNRAWVVPLTRLIHSEFTFLVSTGAHRTAHSSPELSRRLRTAPLRRYEPSHARQLARQRACIQRENPPSDFPWPAALCPTG